MIAWVSHHLPLADGTLVGGAEMTDQRILALAPEEIKVIHPDQWATALDYQKVIITGTDLLPEGAMRQLAAKKPVVAIHHKQPRTPARETLISSASTLICHTPRHLEIELEWTSPKSSTWLLSPHNPSDFQSGIKENFALWAARMHQQKGPDQAVIWAMENSIPLLMYHNKPRQEVLETMSRAKHFVFLPTDFDAEPRTVIEAVLSGCQVHINENVGMGSVPNWDKPDKLAELVSKSAETFWELAL